MTRYRTLEEALVGEGLMSRPELEGILAERDGARSSLGWHLVDAGLLTEEALTTALAKLHDLPTVDINTTIIEPGVLNAFPVERMRRDWFLPLRREGDRLVVAVADPRNVLL